MLYCDVQLDQRWQERYEYDIKGFAVKQKTTYSKYVVRIATFLYDPHTVIMYTHFFLSATSLVDALHLFS